MPLLWRNFCVTKRNKEYPSTFLMPLSHDLYQGQCVYILRVLSPCFFHSIARLGVFRCGEERTTDFNALFLRAGFPT
jgi:hypothetical protein